MNTAKGYVSIEKEDVYGTSVCEVEVKLAGKFKCYKWDKPC